MNNSEPSEYIPDNKIDTSINKKINNPYAFSVAWTNISNSNGVKPPNPQFQPSTQSSYILQQTYLDAPTKEGKIPIGLIQSKREPYAIQGYWGYYGSMQSKLGTNLGS